MRLVGKWLGLAACVFIVILWLASLIVRGTWAGADSAGRHTEFSIRGGAVYARWAKYELINSPGWRIIPALRAPVWRPTLASNAYARLDVVIPLWIPLFIAAVPTLYLFRIDRRPARARCRRCDKRFNGTVCPDCGCKVSGARRPSRRRRRAKRMGLTVCGLLAAVWIGSAWWRLYYVSPSGWRTGVGRGVAEYLPSQNIGIGRAIPFRSAPLGWHLRYDGEPDRTFHWRADLVRYGNFISGYYVQVPLWLPLLMVGLPTGLLCWRDRPIRGFCYRCEYNLTGNVSGRCPECGRRT